MLTLSTVSVSHRMENYRKRKLGQYRAAVEHDHRTTSENTHRAYVSCQSVRFSPDGKTIASASDDETVRLWNTTTGQHLKTITGHTDIVERVCFSPDGKTIASASWDKTVRLWDATTGQH